MIRKTVTGSLLAVSLTAGALSFSPSATAAPTWVDGGSISSPGTLPSGAAFAMSENGNAVAAWVRDVGGVDKVQASYYVAGTDWTSPDTITGALDEVSAPSVAINDAGEAVVTWLEVQDDETRVAASRYIAGNEFDGKVFISASDDYDAAPPLSTQIDAGGMIWVAHPETDGNAKNLVQVSRKVQGEPSTTVTLTDLSSFTPSLAVNEAGQAVLAWYDAGDGESVIKVRRYRPEIFNWTAGDPTSVAGQYLAGDVRTAINDNGDAVIGYVQKDSGGDLRAAVAKSRPDGFLGNTSYASALDVPASGVDVALNDSGQTLVSWNEHSDVERVRWVTRPYNGSFSGISTAPGNLAGQTTTRAAISDSGMYLVGFADGGKQRASFKVTPISPTLTYNSGPNAFQSGRTDVGVDNQGNGFLGGVIALGGGDGVTQGMFLDTAGPVAAVTAPAPNSLSLGFGVKWSATDRFASVTEGRVRVRAAAWNGGFGSFAYPFAYAASTSLPFAGVPGRTYCFSAQARDTHNNTGAFSGEKCTTTPVDDRTLAKAGGFVRKTGAAHYRGTYTMATKNGAVLTLNSVKASRIAILVTKVANGGKIQVKFGTKILGTYSLKGSGLKQLVAQKSLGGLKTGTLTIKVVSGSGKVVKIDGVVAAK